MTAYLDTWTRDKSAGKLSIVDWLKLKTMKVDPTLISGLDPTKLALVTDVSHWQGTIDFSILRNDGKVSMVMPKASDGYQVRDGSPSEPTNYVDDKLYVNVQGCYDNGIACAPYHFVEVHWEGYTQKGMIDANWEKMKTAMDPLVPKKSYHAYMLDVEMTNGSEPNRSSIVMGLIERVRNDTKLSQVPLILYSSNYLLNSFYPGLMNQISYPDSKVVDALDMAQWTYNTYTKTTWPLFWSTYLPKVDMKVITPGFANWTFVQWSSSFELPGCSGRMDVNAYKANEEHLYNWLQFTGGTTPPPEPPPNNSDYVTKEEYNAKMTAIDEAFLQVTSRMDRHLKE